VQWRPSAVAWVDYDHFRGPAGLVLAGASNTGPTDPFVPAARHLARLCDEPGLDGLRAGAEISPPSVFNIGRINTGMGHGVTGVAAALRHAVEMFEDGSDYRSALRHALVIGLSRKRISPTAISLRGHRLGATAREPLVLPTVGRRGATARPEWPGRSGMPEECLAILRFRSLARKRCDRSAACSTPTLT
jgi:hypothetical protein